MLAGCLIGMQPDTPWKVSLLTTEISYMNGENPLNKFSTIPRNIILMQKITLRNNLVKE